MSIEEIMSEAHLDILLETEARGIVLDFWGTWCQPCRSLRPHLQTLADDYADNWKIVAVHIEENVDLVDRYQVQSTPTLIYLRNGSEVHRSSGAVTPSSVASTLADHLS